MHPHLCLILFGFHGCGKTYFGERLARGLKWHFVDTDQLIADNIGQPCRNYLLMQGEAAFRMQERAVIASLELQDKTVLALGGGTLCDDANFSTISQLGRLVYLSARPETLKMRWKRQVSFEDTYRDRIAFYESIDAVRVPIDDRSEEEVLWELIHLAAFSKS